MSETKFLKKDGDNFTAENLKIKSVSAPIDANDAVNKGYCDNNSEIFGSQYLYQVAEEVSATTSTDYQDKINYTTPSLPVGTYRVAYHCLHKISHSSHESGIRFIIDGEMISKGMSKHLEFSVKSGFIHLSFATPGTHVIQLQWRSSHNTKTSYIEKARIEIWRTS